MLRLFFWKDMLARKKRENKLDPTRSEIAKLKIIKKQTTKTKILTPSSTHENSSTLSGSAKKSGQQISIIRSKRSQADDEWPISYKGDSTKRSYNTRKANNNSSNKQFEKRDKRLTLESIETKVENNKSSSNFSSLINGHHHILSKRQHLRENQRETIKTNINDREEELLHRSKRIGES